jgi:KipI family sensor histidine kinase inhibitor
MASRAALADMKLGGITDLVPTYRSLTVHFDPMRLEPQALSKCLLQAAQAAPQEAALATRWVLPVVFGDEFGPDLADVAQTTGRSEAAIIEALCTTELRVFLIGFLPGFPYLGELPEWLRLPRRATPRTAVAANTLAIAGAQAAIYPWASPGGWHLLGRTPARLFDVGNAMRPALLAPGDRVKFSAISRAEFQHLAGEVAAGRTGRKDWQAA